MRTQPTTTKETQEPEQIKKAEEEESSFRRFQWNYLLVYLIVMGTFIFFPLSPPRRAAAARSSNAGLVQRPTGCRDRTSMPSTKPMAS